MMLPATPMPAKASVPTYLPTNKRIYGVVKLLQDISKYQRNGQRDQFPPDIPMQQILCIFHFSASFSYLFQKNSIPISVNPCAGAVGPAQPGHRL